MTAAPPRLEAQSIRCTRGQRVLFDDLCFTLEPGETLVLTGPNGSGKTSLLRLIAGLLPPAEGRLLWRGVDAAQEPETFRRDLSWVGHADGLKPALTVLENLEFSCRIVDGTIAAGSLQNALETVGLGTLADQPARYLSAGQRRRLTLARAAALQRPLWLLDEPTTALDDAGQAMLTGLLAAHAERAGLAVIATHTPIEVPKPRALPLGPADRAAA
jgi:heme exporter protein A